MNRPSISRFACFVSLALFCWGCTDTELPESYSGDATPDIDGQPTDPVNDTDLPTTTVTPARLPMIIGSTKIQVDDLLSDWPVREDRLSTQDTRAFRYTLDVTLVVIFKGNSAVGVAAIDRPGAGVVGISDARFQELVTLIGVAPLPGDILRDSNGIREFYVGDTDG